MSRSARAGSASPSGKFATAATRIAPGSCRRAKAARRGQTQTAAFPPGSTWITFTDQVAHKAASGQYAIEQTCSRRRRFLTTKIH